MREFRPDFVEYDTCGARRHNRYVITDPDVFKTTAIDHSAIPPHDSFERLALWPSAILHDITRILIAL